MFIIYLAFFLSAFFGPYLAVLHDLIHGIRIIPAVVIFLGAFSRIKISRLEVFWIAFVSTYFIYTMVISIAQLEYLEGNDLINFSVLFIFLISLVILRATNQKLYRAAFSTAIVIFMAACAWVWFYEMKYNRHLQFSGMAMFPEDYYYHLPTAFFTNANDFAAVVVLCSMYLHYLVRRSGLTRAINFTIHFYALAVIYTTDSKLAFLVYGIFCIHYYRKWAKSLIPVSIVLLMLWLLGPNRREQIDFRLLSFDLDESSSLMRRYNLYKYGLLSLTDNYALGHGIGGYRHYYLKSVGVDVLHGDIDPHNYFIEILINSGLLVFIATILMHGYFLIYLLRQKVDSLLISQYILYHFILLASSSSLFLWPHYIFFYTYIFCETRNDTN